MGYDKLFITEDLFKELSSTVKGRSVLEFFRPKRNKEGKEMAVVISKVTQ